MPELPDIEVYLEALDARIAGHTLRAVRLGNPFLLRSVEPPMEAALGHTVTSLRRVGKRIAIGLDNDLWLVLHLMIAGRNALAAFDFDHGSLTLTEAGSQRKASLLVVSGAPGLAAIDPGGIEVLHSSPTQFADVLRSANHTLKRALTDPKLFSGIGNAYSDEILHHARLSPLHLTQKLTDAEIERLHASILTVMNDWIERLRAEAASGFPEGVTAFRDDMAVHGRFGKSCPVCAAPVQRIRYATNECNYCARCQTGGRVLADRALSRLLGAEFPRSLDD